MEGYDAATYGDRFADVYDDWYADVSDAVATVERLRTLADGRAVLELGCGTGRLAIPLAATDDVTGLDASSTMLDRLAAKPGGDRVRTILGDMASIEVDGPFGVVFAAFNTFFNLPTAAGQERCLRRVADVLEPDGQLVLECVVPGDGTEPSTSIEAPTLTADRVVLRVTRHEPAEQTISGQHIELTEAGGVRLRPWHLRYARPDELDAMATGAGLQLVERSADWSGRAFDGLESPGHVSIYRKR